MDQLIAEATVVGIVLVFISSIFMGALHIVAPNDYTDCKYLPNKSTKKYYITTFLIGIATHLAFEYVGANKWYCKNSYACNN